MSVNIQFQANQSFQLDAIEAVTNLFLGWEEGESHESTFQVQDDLDALFVESIVGNPWGSPRNYCFRMFTRFKRLIELTILATSQRLFRQNYE